MGTLNLFRPSVGAFAVGMAQAALEATLAHTAQRDAFGGKLQDLPSVAHTVATATITYDHSLCDGIYVAEFCAALDRALNPEPA